MLKTKNARKLKAITENLRKIGFKGKLNLFTKSEFLIYLIDIII